MDKLKFEGIALYSNMVTSFQHEKAAEAKYTLTVLLHRQLQAPLIAQLDEIQIRLMNELCKGAPWRSDMFTIYEVVDDSYVKVPLSSAMRYWSPMVNVNRADGQSITPDLDNEVVGQLVVVSASAGSFGSVKETRSAIGVRLYMNAVYVTGNPSGVDMAAFRGGLGETFDELAEMATASVYAGATAPHDTAPPALRYDMNGHPIPPAPAVGSVYAPPAYAPAAPPAYAPPVPPAPPAPPVPANAWPVDQNGQPIPPAVPADPGLKFD
ncbi:hypothetical protein [Thiolapillus sp.]|uniref:hypothetical protein n=1 Tax=Thiolapillus sp. TaxID=2017437 RepID=UPI0025E71275|nr:hypothetical protein [Thiolapillus sp.]